jgi:mono/diheme cytochrome c family protein
VRDLHVVKALLLLLAALLIGGAAFVYSGVFDVAADDPHWGITLRALETVRDRSIAVRSRGIEVPSDLDDPQRIARGAHEYDEMCHDCHVEPGDDDADEEMRVGMYPQPPNFARDGVRRSPEEAFWIVKHGLKMTGMPAWGATHDDATLWSIVAFLQKLPRMSEAEFDRLESAGRTDHHHGDDDEEDDSSGRGRGRGGDSNDR